jgi:cobaltochelatase CobT
MTKSYPSNTHSNDEFKNATSSVIRAISRLKDADTNYGEVMPFPGRNISSEEATIIRACADRNALKLRYHNDDLFKKNTPQNPETAMALEAMEQARCEALGMKEMAGVAYNLNCLLETRLKEAGCEEAGQRTDIPFTEALHTLTRIYLTGETPTPACRKVIDLWQPWIQEHLEKSDMAELASGMPDQEAFALKARNILGKLGFDTGGEGKDYTEEAEDAGEENSDSSGGQVQEKDSSGQSDYSEDENADEQTSVEMDEIGSQDSQEDIKQEQAHGEVRFERPEGYLPDSEGLYQVYTSAYDETVRAEDLAGMEDLGELRSRLDNQLNQLHGLVTKLANRLQRMLLAKQQRSWQFDMEEGILDTSRLSKIIANPTVQATYKQETETRFRDTVVTLLIDNSGSMRGRPITTAAICTDIIARTLERSGVKVEILGFTTSAWRGGKSRELWLENGRPPNPGRLNDLRHIIYKDADAPWRRTRKNLGLMLKEGMLKENIDGEALAWAYNRLVRRQEQRKILLVISDGAPVDDSTLSANTSGFLERDLKKIAQWIENNSEIELAAIGIGHDVSRYYSKAMTIPDAGALAEALTSQLTDLFHLKPEKLRRR